VARAPPVTSYTVASTGAGVADEAILLLLVDDAMLVAVLLPALWDADAGTVFADPAAEDNVVDVFVDDDDFVLEDDVLVDDLDDDDDDDDGGDDDGDVATAVACDDADERVSVGLAVDTSVTVLTDTVAAESDDSVTVWYTVCETVVGASDSTSVETTVVCAAAVLDAADPPSTLTTA
jgi:hypothetical protein